MSALSPAMLTALQRIADDGGAVEVPEAQSCRTTDGRAISRRTLESLYSRHCLAFQSTATGLHYVLTGKGRMVLDGSRA